jgi:hypothetical protein
MTVWAVVYLFEAIGSDINLVLLYRQSCQQQDKQDDHPSRVWFERTMLQLGGKR